MRRMEYRDLVREFVHRTKVNLDTIDRLHDEGASVYEVTQLINSMLGLVVILREALLKHIPAVPIEELENEGWPKLKIKGDVKNLSDLARLLRNGAAHFNWEVMSHGFGDIDAIRIWNLAGGREGQETASVTMGAKDLRMVFERWVELIDRLLDDNG